MSGPRPQVAIAYLEQQPVTKVRLDAAGATAIIASLCAAATDAERNQAGEEALLVLLPSLCEADLIELATRAALRQAGGLVVAAAKQLGVTRRTLYTRLKRARRAAAP